MRPRRPRDVPSVITAALAVALLTSCELEEITVVDVEDVVIAEIYVNLASDPMDNEVRAFLHRTVGVQDGNVDALADATITVTRADGLSLTLLERGFDDCVQTAPEVALGACFMADSSETWVLAPRDVLAVRVDLVDGGTITGATRVPGSFELADVPGACRLEPDTLMPVAWSHAEGAWAYVNETLIRGLPEALRPEGITVEEDPLYLLGLSVSAADTTIVFPSEFGLFNRFELAQDLTVRLQRGLPSGTSADVTITAVDRNYVNWARGGNFNPSGHVRVPSLRGDGTGVFGSTIVRRFDVASTGDPIAGVTDCPVPDPL
jgi:hypothetical protein